jgi:hypothetical protein
VLKWVESAIQASKVHLLSTDHEGEGEHTWRIPFDPSLKEVTISLSGPGPEIEVRDPLGMCCLIFGPKTEQETQGRTKKETQCGRGFRSKAPGIRRGDTKWSREGDPGGDQMMTASCQFWEARSWCLVGMCSWRPGGAPGTPGKGWD